MSNRKIFWTLFILVNLVPIAAYGATNQKSKKSKLTVVKVYKLTESADAAAAPAPAKDPSASPMGDLSRDEANKVFAGPSGTKDAAFNIGPMGTDQIGLTGLMWKDCRDKFSFTNTDTDTSGQIQSDRVLGIRILDLGGGRSCQLAHLKRGDSCGVMMADCYRLSQLDGTLFNFAKKGDSVIGLVRMSTSDKSEPDVDVVTKHESEETKRNREMAALREARARHVAQLRNQVAKCTNNAGQLIIARESLQELLDLNEVTEDEAAKFQRDIDRASLKDLEKRINSASQEELTLLREEVAVYVNAHEGNSMSNLNLYGLMVQRQIALKNGSPKGYEMASQLIDEAKIALPGLSGGQKMELEMRQRDLAINQLGAFGKSGLQGNQNFANYYNNLWSRLNWDANQYCGACQNEQIEALQNGQGAEQSAPSYSVSPTMSTANCNACNNTIAALGKVGQMPKDAAQVDVARENNRRMVQQQLASATMSAQNQGQIQTVQPMMQQQMTQQNPMATMLQQNSTPMNGIPIYGSQGMYGNQMQSFMPRQI